MQHRIACIVLSCLTGAATGLGGRAGAVTYIPETTITGTANWTAAGSPYVVQGDVTIAPGGTLVVDRGVTVHFSMLRKMVVKGSLVAHGGAGEDLIVFTALTDAPPQTPAMGYWGHILVTGQGASASLRYCHIRYGGSNIVTPQALLGVSDGAACQVTDCDISRSAGAGVHARGSSIDIARTSLGLNTGPGLVLKEIAGASVADCRISQNGYFTPGVVGLDAEGCTGLTISGSEFSNNSSFGVKVTEGSGLLIERCSFPFNMHGAVSLSGVSGRLAPVESTGHGKILLDGCSIQGEEVWTEPGLDYQITGTLVVAPQAKLTIREGMVVKFTDPASRIVVDGTLDADGASGGPVWFTSLRDRDGSSAAVAAWNDPPGAAGDWGHILARTGGAVSLRRCIVRYGGSGHSAPAASVASEGGELKLSNCDIVQGAGDGVFFDESGSFARNCIIAWHAGHGIDYATQPLHVGYTSAWANQDGTIREGYDPWRVVALQTHDPKFVRPHLGDFELLPGSPCIATGDPGQYGTVADRGAVPYEVPFTTSRVADVKGQPEGRRVLLEGVVVSAEPSCFSGDYFYAQQEDRAGGIRIAGPDLPAVTRGDVISVLARIRSACVERVAHNQLVTVTGRTGAPVPLGMRNRSLGGSALNAMTPGVTGSSGPHNLGLLVRTWGQVVDADEMFGSYLYIDDGADLDAGYGARGLSVSPWFSIPSSLEIGRGDYVEVTGICQGVMKTGEESAAILVPRDAEDIRVISNSP